MKVKNPNNYDISIVSSDLDIIINGNPVGKANFAEKIKLPKKSEEVHRFVIESNFDKTGSGLLTTLASVLFTQSVKLSVKGDVTAKAMFVQKKIKVEFNENVAYSLK